VPCGRCDPISVARFRLKALAPSEAQTQAAILRYLAIAPRVAWAQRMNSGAIKIPVPGGKDRFVRYGFPGCPDILGMFTDGRLLAIEVKSPTGRPTPEQAAFLAKVAENGGVAVLAKSVDDVIAAINA
jgi:VRR-NUC domain